ncbi:MAG: hypothetical protein NTW78_05305 [Campylobacterales bacterium]|nr:hypothetical protein [Campylobacterales bacterium]
MLPLIIGGVALAATGYGIKKFLENEDNQDKVSDAIMSGCDWIDGAHQKTDKFFDGLSENAERFFDEKDTQTKPLYIDLSGEVGEFMPKLRQFAKVKRDFLISTHKELRVALGEIKNLEKAIDITPPEQIEENYELETVTDVTKEKLNSFVTILIDTQGYIDTHLDKLDAIIISSDDYTSYSDEDKRYVQALLELHNTLEKAINSTLTNDGLTISREIQRAFGKIQSIVG